MPIQHNHLKDSTTGLCFPSAIQWIAVDKIYDIEAVQKLIESAHGKMRSELLDIKGAPGGKVLAVFHEVDDIKPVIDHIAATYAVRPRTVTVTLTFNIESGETDDILKCRYGKAITEPLYDIPEAARFMDRLDLVDVTIADTPADIFTP